jgi:hypothetical protein
MQPKTHEEKKPIISKVCVEMKINKKHSQFKHGMSGTKFYMVWSGMKRRCYNKKEECYPRYGGRGIRVSNEWLNFINFYNDMYDGYSDGLQIDRIDNGLGYSKENCRWVTLIEQANNKSSIVLYEYNGKSLSIGAWAREVGIKKSTLRARIKIYGWNIGKAITTPVRVKSRIRIEGATMKVYSVTHKLYKGFSADFEAPTVSKAKYMAKKVLKEALQTKINYFDLRAIRNFSAKPTGVGGGVMKKVYSEVIGSCLTCDFRKKLGWKCNHINGLTEKLPHDLSFPTWCPLPDHKEGEDE